MPSGVAAQLWGLSREAEIMSGKDPVDTREAPQDSPTAGRSLRCLAELSCSQITQPGEREGGPRGTRIAGITQNYILLLWCEQQELLSAINQVLICIVFSGTACGLIVTHLLQSIA